MKRAIDVILAGIGLAVLSPFLLVLATLIYLQDFKSPFYIAERVGRDNVPFRMIKLRSMVVGADRTGVMSTAATDARVTRLGRVIRRWKLDEITQLVNVLRGDISLVGPRPNVASEVALYTDEERRMLHIRPGMTDVASIVFSDEAEILAYKPDPDAAYNQLIRPWKSRLGLFYVDHRDTALDVRLIALTLMSLCSRERALVGVEHLLRARGADEVLCTVAARRAPLSPTLPPS